MVMLQLLIELPPGVRLWGAEYGLSGHTPSANDRRLLSCGEQRPVEELVQESAIERFRISVSP